MGKTPEILSPWRALGKGVPGPACCGALARTYRGPLTAGASLEIRRHSGNQQSGSRRNFGPKAHWIKKPRGRQKWPHAERILFTSTRGALISPSWKYTLKFPKSDIGNKRRNDKKIYHLIFFTISTQERERRPPRCAYRDSRVARLSARSSCVSLLSEYHANSLFRKLRNAIICARQFA